MAKTLNFTVDAVGNPEPIVVQTVCFLLRIRQNDLDAASVSFNTYVPAMTDDPVLHPATENVEFHSRDGFLPGQILGYVAMFSGSVAFAQEEE